jgi:ATP synthase F1 complex assembly factor 2
MKDDTTRAEVREALLKYLDTDTIWCVFTPFSKYLVEWSPSFFHNNPEPLERLQTKHWTPLLDWARSNFDVQLNISESILSAAQPTATREKFRKVLESFDQWEMAGVSIFF